ncbi:hypothetical protein KDK_63710 [Dictyobacter kobayashii]|uniref:Uncharacterized protein n=1 Tax=Dictyobacter kobayashii TaxID=2014872 RepID=A0A402AQ11_9CHLR|nr:hypothetical protein KDK_05040 [Dictyobacter kobayashii]GCE19100.1 hypothetical protein KDK_29000 [Dictyobacter kobayashii]GCE20691.1 hypothetical protein KDK_44910 [Dictyobacter kobayashii]GCE21080.1 hypothetical protein KDK_48800 [Dictyobacter kobayashii]GCE22571.1 hypothetical protein KDK_63710 [Dictyobacter kobayashii]
MTIFSQSPFKLFNAQQGTYEQSFELFDPAIFLLCLLFECLCLLFELSVGFLKISHFFFCHALSLSALSSFSQGTE